MRNKVLKISGLVLVAIFLGLMIGFALFSVAMGYNEFLMPYGPLSVFYVGFFICGLVIGITTCTQRIGSSSFLVLE